MSGIGKSLNIDTEYIGGSRKKVCLPVHTSPAAIVATVEAANPKSHSICTSLFTPRISSGMSHEPLCVVFRGRQLDPSDKSTVIHLLETDVLLAAPGRRTLSASTANVTPNLSFSSQTIPTTTTSASTASSTGRRSSSRRVIRDGQIVDVDQNGEVIGGDESEEEDEDDEAIDLPDDAAQWEVCVVNWMKNKRGRGCPKELTDLVVTIRPRRLAILILFLIGCKIASWIGIGPPFILISLIVMIFCNLGKRRKGELSAYSIFNPGVQRLPGQLDAQKIDEQLRRGMQI